MLKFGLPKFQVQRAIHVGRGTMMVILCYFPGTSRCWAYTQVISSGTTSYGPCPVDVQVLGRGELCGSQLWWLHVVPSMGGRQGKGHLKVGDPW